MQAVQNGGKAMRATRCVRAMLIWGLAWICLGATGRAQQADEERFELRGKVVNAATGAAVGNALVELFGPEAHVQFSGDDGSFVFTDVRRGRYQVVARKPGYFNEQELGRGFGGPIYGQSVPSDDDVTLKLTPEGIIYGRVENENGQPIERMTVRAQAWQVTDGIRRLDTRGTAETDDEGKFRIAELTPGDYFISFFPENRGERVFNQLARKNQNEQGYGTQFYPGVADAGSASVIHIRAGAQVQITQALKPQRLYQVAGVVRGAKAERGFAVGLTDTNGDLLQRGVHLDEKSGGFQIEGVPEGTYLLTANAQDVGGVGPEEEVTSLTAMMPIHLNKDLTGLVLVLGRGASVGVEIDDEIPAQGDELHQVNLNLVSKEFAQLSQSIIVPQPKNGQGAPPQRFEGVAPGTYEVEAWSAGRGYVASLRCGDVDLMRDELTVAARAAMPPIEVTLRNDGAELDVEATENGQPVGASVLVYSEEYPKKSYQGITTGNEGVVHIGNIRPGAYKVVALQGLGLQGVEFRDPAFMEKYLAQGKEMDLKPGDKVSVQVEVQTREEQ